MKNFFFLFAFILLPTQLFAAREVEFEWEEIEGAKKYEVEINQGTTLYRRLQSNTFIFKTEIAPGKYQIRGKVIGKDLLQTHSEWSPWKNFDIPPDQVADVKVNKMDHKVTPPSFKARIPLMWQPSLGASDYVIEVTEINKKETTTIISTKNSTILQLRPGLYSIKIQSRTSDGLASDPFELAERLFVQKAVVPSPSKIELNVDQGRVSFQTPSGTSVIVSLDKQAFLSTKWKTVELKTTNNLSQWDPQLGPGKYRLTLVSKNAFGEISKPVLKEFVIKPKEADLPP